MENRKYTKTKEELDKDYVYNVPSRTKDAIDRFVEYGHIPGSFTQAVLKNDLKMAFIHADRENRYHIDDIVKYLWNHVPSTAWGSEKTFKKWRDYIRGDRPEPQ